LNRKIFAFGTFLDVEGAFDNASFNSMINASLEHTVDTMSTKWIDSMLRNRTVRAEIRGAYSTMQVQKGCPQGGVLSPLLWNMVIDSLLCRLESQGLWAQDFADDVVILINGKFLVTVCELMQRALSIVQGWYEQVGLSVNPNKTTASLFTKNRNLNGFIKPTLCVEELELQNQVKYLGVILDSKLNWNNHICVKQPLPYGNVGEQLERLGIETKGCILDIHFGSETHSDIRCHNLVEKATQSSENTK
jgi:Reverse transcriptase (RNA-dependent DNA polymerase)